MALDPTLNGRSGARNPIALIGTRAMSATLRPLSGVMGAALGAGRTLERRAVDRVLDSPELERIVLVVVDSERLQATLGQALSSPGAKRLIDSFFDSGLFDRLIERLADSDALWRLVDEIAQSPAVAEAVSQQGLGFADQVGSEVRTRSRRADDWLERAAHRLTHRPATAPPAEPEADS